MERQIMTAIDNTPQNRNFLSPLNFKFSIKKAPNVNFFIQKVMIPQISLNPTPEYSNPMIRIPLPGEFVKFAPLSISFRVDEDLTNYLEIFNWITSLGDYTRDGKYKSLQDSPLYTGDGIMSDLSLMVLSSTKMPNYEIVFIDAFPTELTALTLTTTDTDVNYVEATAEFRYTYFDISKV